MKEVSSALAIAGKGLEGDHAHGGQRQVTLLSLEAWEAAASTLDTELSPACRRANIVVSGLNLLDTIGKELEIGEVVLSIKDYNPPCVHMETYAKGLMHALQVDRRAGVFGIILRGGEIRSGLRVVSVAERP